MGFQPEAPSS